MHLPRPVADLYCLAHDLATAPRVVLLNRSHNQWRGPAWIAAACVSATLGLPVPRPVLVVVAAAGALSWALDLAGTAAHIAWQRGLIWTDIACEWCDPDNDDGDGGDDPDDDPDPDGPSSLAAEVETWLRTHTTIRHPA